MALDELTAIVDVIHKEGIRPPTTTRNLLSRHSKLSDAVDAIFRDVVEAVSRRVLRSPSDAPRREDDSMSLFHEPRLPSEAQNLRRRCGYGVFR
jgi:hypothetical protein